MTDKIVAFKPSVSYNQRFLRECVAFQHFNQCADFIFLWLWLNDDIGKGTAENVIKRRDMKLIYAVWNTVILNKGGRFWVTRQIDRRSVTSKTQSILAKLSHFGCLKFCLRTPFTTAFSLNYLHATEKASGLGNSLHSVKICG